VSNDAVRFGIIGCGRVATGAVGPAIGWAKNAELVCVGSRDEATARAKAKELGAKRGVLGYDAVLADPEIDAVYIGLPNRLHAEWTRRALAAGKHVLCEKSLTDDATEARALSEDARGRGLRLVEAFMFRHHPQWTLVRRLLADGAIGELTALRAWLSGPMAPEDHRLAAGGGGALFDVTCYAVNAARFLLDAEPQVVTAIASWRGDVELLSMATLAFPRGSGESLVLASVWGSLASSTEQGLVVSGTLGRIEVARPFVPGWEQTELVLHRNGDRSQIRAGGANHYLHMVEHFASLVADPQDTFPSEDGAANVAACEAIREAARAVAGRTMQRAQ
jgi:predicted dehydrogenase